MLFSGTRRYSLACTGSAPAYAPFCVGRATRTPNGGCSSSSPARCQSTQAASLAPLRLSLIPDPPSARRHHDVIIAAASRAVGAQIRGFPSEEGSHGCPCRSPDTRYETQSMEYLGTIEAPRKQVASPAGDDGAVIIKSYPSRLYPQWI